MHALWWCSGDSLCIWDPQGRSLSKPSAAGHEYKCTGGNAQLVDQFPDQFACWDFGGMDVRKTMHSTLIRLPLRTEAMAQNSSLSKVLSSICCPHCVQNQGGATVDLPGSGC